MPSTEPRAARNMSPTSISCHLVTSSACTAPHPAWPRTSTRTGACSLRRTTSPPVKRSTYRSSDASRRRCRRGRSAIGRSSTPNRALALRGWLQPGGPARSVRGSPAWRARGGGGRASGRRPPRALHPGRGTGRPDRRWPGGCRRARRARASPRGTASVACSGAGARVGTGVGAALVPVLVAGPLVTGEAGGPRPLVGAAGAESPGLEGVPYLSTSTGPTVGRSGVPAAERAADPWPAPSGAGSAEQVGQGSRNAGPGPSGVEEVEPVHAGHSALEDGPRVGWSVHGAGGDDARAPGFPEARNSQELDRS